MKFEWIRDPWRVGGCPENELNPGGWYISGTTTLITINYKNPSTGKPYTQVELRAIPSGVTETPVYVRAASSGSTWVVAGIGLVIVMAIVAFVMLK